MAKSQTELERRRWDLAVFCPFASDPEAAAGLVESAVARSEAALASGQTAVQLQSYRELLGRASNVGSLADVLAETAEGSMEAFVRRLELPLHRYRTTLVELRRALSLANEAETVNLDEGAAFAAWRSEAARTPGAEALRWRTLGQTFGFDALGDVHRKLCREAFQGEVSFGGRTVAVTTDSWRAQLNDESRELRTAVWDFVLARAAAVEPVLGRIKLSRLRFVSESARLRGFEDARTAAFAGFRVPVSVADTLRKLAPRTRSLADRYYRNKGKLLGISPLRDFDVVAPLAGIATDGLAFSRVIEVLRGELEERAPAYAQVLDEVLAGETLLSDPLASKSASWFVYADGNGGLPLVHVPYHRNLECYSAVAHELGHACHLTQLARTRGPIAQADDSLVLNEMFAIYFEIVALSGSLARAATSAERRFWRDALLEQGLHFMRTLPIWAHFEEGVHGGEAPEAAFRHATAALTPDWLSHGEVDQRWALQIHTEQMPFYGYGYQAAYAFALLMYLRCDATSLLRLATESPWQPLASVMGRLLNVELASQTAFDPVLGWLEGLLDQDQ